MGDLIILDSTKQVKLATYGRITKRDLLWIRKHSKPMSDEDQYKNLVEAARFWQNTMREFAKTAKIIPFPKKPK